MPNATSETPALPNSGFYGGATGIVGLVGAAAMTVIGATRGVARSRSGRGAGGAAVLLATAAALGCASVAWAQPVKHQPRKTGAARSRPDTAQGGATRRPATVKVSCAHADFEFTPDGGLADVVDRDFRDEVVTTVGELRASPRQFVISWQRNMSTRVGPRTLRNRYLIDRATGRTQVQQIDDLAGFPAAPTSRAEQCAITK